ncbi:hypothetical protein HY485_03510 [Candidatus Woesearchaeota archaeon]|nr:hypothetical protein [Candidatus Woesearchaeota archaeon]
MSKAKTITIIVSLVIFLWITNWVYGYYFLPGPYDTFAQCLAEKGATMYGAMGWCEYTQQQRVMFGKSFKHLNYKEYTEFPAEFGKIRKTPTWVINGKTYENVQSFERLAQLTGCALN